MKRTIGRPIGAHIREIVAIAEQLGPCTCPQIRAQLHAPMESSNVWKYCSRAVGLGLLIVDRSARPTQYRPAEGWRAKVSGAEPRARLDQPAQRVCQHDTEPGALDACEIVAAALRTQVSSVFALARQEVSAC